MMMRNGECGNHMHSKFKVGASEMCSCNADIMTAEHLLQHCQLHASRLDMWPEPILFAGWLLYVPETC